MRFGFLVLAVSMVLVPGRGEPRGLSLEALRLELARQISQERFRPAQWGVKAVSLETGALVFEAGSEKLLKPASGAKLFTGALALDLLGPEYRIRTSLYSGAALADGVLQGDLIVYGRGDPSFSTRFETGRLSRVVQAVQRAGIRRIEGDLAGDASFFSGPPFGTGWNWDDLQYAYGAEVAALSVQDNVIDLVIRPGGSDGGPCRITAEPPGDFVALINRTKTGPPGTPGRITIERPPGENRAVIDGVLPRNGPPRNDAVTVSNPALWFVVLLKEELARHGIVVTGGTRVSSQPAPRTEWKELEAAQSPPMALLVERMMKPSQNLYAQLLLLQAGAPGQEAGTTEEAGLKQLRAFSGRAGIPSREVLLDEGSGLSRSALVTPGAVVRLLTYMNTHRNAGEFRASLPEPGEGTLRGRLPELKGRLRAKTGTLRYVNTLSGYLTSAAGEALAFSIMLNAYDGNGRDEVDAVAQWLARLGERTN